MYRRFECNFRSNPRDDNRMENKDSDHPVIFPSVYTIPFRTFRNLFQTCDSVIITTYIYHHHHRHHRITCTPRVLTILRYSRRIVLRRDKIHLYPNLIFLLLFGYYKCTYRNDRDIRTFRTLGPFQSYPETMEIG